MGNTPCQGNFSGVNRMKMLPWDKRGFTQPQYLIQNKNFWQRCPRMLVNTSDHVQLYLKYSRSLETINSLPEQMAEIPVSKQKVHWSNFAQEEIIMMYATTLISEVSELENLKSDVQNVCENYVKSITELILVHSQCLAAPIFAKEKEMK